MIKCARANCKWTINEKFYVGNELGLEESCLAHHERHKKDQILKNYFIKCKTDTQESQS